MASRSPSAVDVVVVSYNSRDRLRACVESLVSTEGVSIYVVDNASPDESLAVVADLPITPLPQNENWGFARGCNIGWRAGDAPYVLLLNPDARITPASLEVLVRMMENDPTCGVAAPRIEHLDGSVDHSQRRFERLGQVYAEAFFLHRLFPARAWTDGTVRDSTAYAAPTTPEWVSGACLLIRRRVLDELDGLDERFFLYCEDMDLCKRIWDLGYEVQFVPDAVAVHEGGASAPHATTIPILARSRLQYAKKHFGPVGRPLHRLGLGLAAVTHVFVSRGGVAVSAAHVRALRLISSV